MSYIALTFTPDGRGHCLFTEVINLGDLGPLAIERATHIEFDNKAQYWRVRDRDGFAMFNSPSRQECLDWERQYFNSQEEMKHALQHGANPVTACAGVDGRARQDAGGCAPGV